jgi:tRNA-intron endonuclease
MNPPRTSVLATGRLDGDRAVVADPAQASRLHAKGSVGTPGPAGQLSLGLVEAAWSVDEGRLALLRDGKPLALADILALGAGGGHRTETEYIVYRDLRDRGLVVRPAAPGRLAVWPRGTDQGDAQFQVHACSDRDGLDPGLLLEAAASRSILSVADADGAVTHYQAALDTPGGDVPMGDLPRAKGAVLADRVLVSDPAAAQAYHQREFLGTRHGAALFLSFTEAETLRRRGVLSAPAGLVQGAHAERLLAAHSALRRGGAVPKSGFKFGTDLRAYRSAPDDGHAEWLVHCAADGEPLPWSALSRGVRLSHGVRKKFLVALPGPEGDGPTFAHLAWFRP